MAFITRNLHFIHKRFKSRRVNVSDRTEGDCRQLQRWYGKVIGSNDHSCWIAFISHPKMRHENIAKNETQKNYQKPKYPKNDKWLMEALILIPLDCWNTHLTAVERSLWTYFKPVILDTVMYSLAVLIKQFMNVESFDFCFFDFIVFSVRLKLYEWFWIQPKSVMAWCSISMGKSNNRWY